MKQRGASPGRSRTPVRAAVCAALLAVTITGATATSASAISLPPFLQRLLHPNATPTPAPSPGSQKPDVGSSPSPSPSASPGQQPMPVNRGNAAILASDTLQVTNLRSLAVTTVDSAAGAVKVIQLRADASTITGVDLLGPCNAGVMIHVTGTRQVASGGVTINSTALQLTALGHPVSLNASSLPATPTLTLPGVSLPALPTNTAFLSVKMDVALVQAGAITITGLHQVGIPC